MPSPNVGDATAAYDRLTACGVRLHFHVDDRSAGLTVLAYDEQGTVLGSLTPTTVVELACRGTSECVEGRAVRPR